jgi:hypothetical protein
MEQILAEVQTTNKLCHAILTVIKQEVSAIMSDFTALTAAVAADTSVDASVLTLLQQLAAQVSALQPNQASIDALATQLTQNAASLQAAITANTPVTPAQSAAKK